MIRYVCGFAFNKSETRVVLIRKEKPDFQKGKLNGVGGKIEHQEGTLEAIVREFKEETGVDTIKSNWLEVAIVYGENYEFHYLASWLWDYKLNEVTQTEEEEPVIISPDDLDSHEIMPNLKWTIPLCRDRYLRLPIRMEAGYTGD